MLCDMYSVGAHSLRTTDVFTVVASLPPKDKIILKIKLFFGGREATTVDTFAVRRLARVHTNYYRYNRGTQRKCLENICSEDDLRSRIFGTLVLLF